MSDYIKNQANLVFVRGPGELIPFNREILDDAKRAVRILRQGLQKREALRHLLYLCHAAGEVDEYLEFSWEVGKMPEMASLITDVLLFAGIICEENRRFDKALEYYLRCMEFDCDDNWVRYARAINAGFCYLMKGNLLKAKEHTQDAISIDPERWYGWKNLGLCFEALDNPREAADCYVRTIQILGGHIVPIVHLRELIKRHADRISNLDSIREEMLNKGILV